LPSPTIFLVRDFGANAVAYPAEQLALVNLRYKWLQFPPGLTATIYHKRDGEDFDSTGIQAAIDAAHAAGGGTVHVPAGDYLIKPIRLKSGVRLHLDTGARLWGSPILDDHDGRQPLVHASDAENVSITGQGQISGQSPKWVIPWIQRGRSKGSGINY